MIVELLEIPDVLLLKPRVFRDDRGRFLETWHDERYAVAGLPSRFVQDNVSVSRRGALRGLHFQHPNAQGKLVTVLAGRAFDVAVDIRRGSPTFGRWVGRELTGDSGHQLWIPAGFAHGFLAVTDDVVFAYKCTGRYSPDDERCVRWDDPAIGIQWPHDSPVLSTKDGCAQCLNDFSVDALPTYSVAGP